MPKDTEIKDRKLDHIKINLEKDVRSSLTTGLENYHFIHEALPELDLERVNTSLSLFGKKLAAPILISSMTGGTEEAERSTCVSPKPRRRSALRWELGVSVPRLNTPNKPRRFKSTRGTGYFIVRQSRRGSIELRLWHRPMQPSRGHDPSRCVDPAFKSIAGSGSKRRRHKL